MPSSEDLVPTGLPQGSRKQVEQGMRQAQLPLGSSPGPSLGARTVAPGRPSSAASLPIDLANLKPTDFPWASEQPPEQAAPVQISVLDSLAGSAQSEYGRAVLARLAQ